MDIGKPRGYECHDILSILFHPIMKLVAVGFSK